MSVEFRLPNINATTTEGKIEQLQSFIYQLVQELNFYMNLDKGQTTTTESQATRDWITKIEDAEGNYSQLSQTVDGISAKVSAEGKTGSLDVWANNVDVKVSGKDGEKGSIEVWSDLVETKVSGTDGKKGSLEVWKDKIALKVHDNDNEGSLEVKVDEINSSVKGAYYYWVNDTDYTITKEGYGEPTGEGTENDVYIDLTTGYLWEWDYGVWSWVASCTQSSKSIGSQVTQLADKYVVKVKSDGSLAKLQLGVDPTTSTSSIQIAADYINLNGNVLLSNYVNGISNGTTTINGGCIKTGAIEVKDDDNNTVFSANMTDKKVNIGGFIASHKNFVGTTSDDDEALGIGLQVCSGNLTNAIAVGFKKKDSNWATNSKFRVTKTGATYCKELYATGGNIGGLTIASDGSLGNNYVYIGSQGLVVYDGDGKTVSAWIDDQGRVQCTQIQIPNADTKLIETYKPKSITINGTSYKVLCKE